MSDNLLAYYNRELAYIRRLGAEFARANPKIAAHLNMTEDTIEDPHVSRLIEAFAFLNARTREKLDDYFPELTDALLNVLYPHYLAPIPSMAIVQFKPSHNLTGHYQVPRHTMIETLPMPDEPCQFRTGYTVDMYPIKVKSAHLEGHRRHAPAITPAAQVSAVLRLEVMAYSKPWSELNPSYLRFYLKGQSQQMFALYELLMHGTAKLALAKHAEDPNPIYLNAEHLQPVGLNVDEDLLDYSAQSFLGYRLLTEFFAFPEKFLFLDIVNLKKEYFTEFTDKLCIYLYLKETNEDLEQHIHADNFALYCTPMINLFPFRTAPITITHREPEYHIVTHPQRQKAFEIYRINSVNALYHSNKKKYYAPFYGFKHEQNNKQFWYAARRAALIQEKNVDKGTELYISLVDLDMQPSTENSFVLDIETLACNRDLPASLPFGGNEPYLQFSTLTAPVERIHCLTQPSPTRRIDLKQGAQWRLISHLSLNHLSLSGGKAACEALKEILRLYDFVDSPQSRILRNSLLSIQSKRVLARDPSGLLASFCQGIEICIELDEERFVGSSAYLFMSVLERFFALYCNINSFTRLVVKNKGKQKTLYEWAPRSGEQVLL